MDRPDRLDRSVAIMLSMLTSTCPPNTILMARFNYSNISLLACESFSTTHDGKIHFVPAADAASAPGFPLVLAKHTASSLPVGGNDTRYYANMSKAHVLAAATDVMGEAVLSATGAADPELDDVTTAVPPIRDIYNARVWVASRASGVDACLDADAGSGSTPTPSMAARHLPGLGSSRFDVEGTLGDGLPTLLLGFPVNESSANDGAAARLRASDLAAAEAAEAAAVRARRYIEAESHAARVDSLRRAAHALDGSGGGSNAGSALNSSVVLWQMAAVPVAAGYDQRVAFRFLSVDGAGTVRARYYDTFAYVPSVCGDDDTDAGCMAAGPFYAALLDLHLSWERTWREERRMSLVLPAAAPTDGDLLVRQAVRCLVLDMTTRVGGIWPRYGTAPGYEESGVGSNGFQEIFTSSMMGALEWGLFGYARDVITNWLTHYQLPHGAVLYRGLEMAQQGRALTVIAMYYAYTRDAAPLLDGLEAIGGIAAMLQRRRDAALAAHPSMDDPRRGMPTGNDEADLYGVTVAGHADTAYPFISIAAEAWRGLRDCGEALAAIAAALPPSDPRAARAAALAATMSAAAPPLLADLRRSMALDATLVPDVTGTGNVTCHPYAAGVRECGMLPGAPSNRDSEPWRTYSEALYSGALEPATIDAIVTYHQRAQGAGVRGSRLKLGVLSGCGADVSCGDQLETFTVHGWGYGLLMVDRPRDYLLQYFALSAHGYTRGTHIAPESTPLNRSNPSPPFATPSGLTAPILLKWLLAWEHPTTRTLWIGRALPRVWLAHGRRVAARDLPTAYGRLGLSLASSVGAAGGTVAANLSLPAAMLAAPPPGGLTLRLRVPGAPAVALRGATVGGKAWAAVNASDATLHFDAAALRGAAMGARMQAIVATFATAELHEPCDRLQ